MKISSASKKVLASALSAAMVVAFAPTVAFGQIVPGDKVTVSVDDSGLTVAEGSTAFASTTEVTISDLNTIDLGSTFFNGHQYKFADGTNVTSWYADIDGDGAYDSKKDIELSGSNVIANADSVTAGSTLVIKPKAAATAIAVSAPTTYSATGVTVVLKNNTTSAIAKADTTVALYKGSSFVAGMKVDASGDIAAAGTENVTITAANLEVGTYTVKAFNNVNGNDLGSISFEVVEVAVSTATTNTSIKAIVGAEISAQLQADKGTVTALVAPKGTNNVVEYTSAGKTVATYDGANFAAVTPAVKVASGMTLTAVYDDQAVVEAPKFGLSSDISTKVDVENTAATKIEDSIKYAGASADLRVKLSGAVTKTYDIVAADAQGAATVTYEFGSTSAATGTYTFAWYKVENRGNNLEKETLLGTKSITLTKVTFDANGGEFSDGKTAKTGVVNAEELVQDVDPAAPSYTGHSAIGWSTDGATAIDTAKTKVGASEVTFKYAWYVSSVAAPTYSYADGKLALTSDAGTNYKTYFTVSNSSLSGTNISASTHTLYTAPFTVDPAKTGYIKFQTLKNADAAGLGDSAAVELNSYNKSFTNATGYFTSDTTPVTEVETFAVAASKCATAASTSTAPQTYADVLATLATDSKNAIMAKGYATAKDWETAVLAQEKAVLQAIADYNNAQIDALVAGVTNADGTVSKLDASVAELQKAKIAAVITDFEYNTDAKAATAATGTYVNNTDYVDAITAVVTATGKLATKYAKADVDAAAAVTAQLKDPATAAAGLEAYKALTAAQKELVASADVAAAEEAVAKAAEAEAAAALVKAQDKAAAATGKAKVKGSVYSIKAKGSKTIKLAKSASGAKTTLIQKSGTKYAKVSGTTIKLKAAAKAGKTYTIKVKVKSGTYTTATVSFKVKVKK